MMISIAGPRWKSCPEKPNARTAGHDDDAPCFHHRAGDNRRANDRAAHRCVDYFRRPDLGKRQRMRTCVRVVAFVVSSGKNPASGANRVWTRETAPPEEASGFSESATKLWPGSHLLRADLRRCKVMTHIIILRGAYAITDPRLGASGVIPAGAVVIMGGTVKETGLFAHNRSPVPRRQDPR